MSHRGYPTVASASVVMAAGTVISRTTGLVRNILLVAAIGLGTAHADVFNVANTIPNSLYILVAGGIFNVVLVPQLVRAMRSDPDGGQAYANRIITLGALVLTAVSVVLVVVAPLLMHIFASGNYFTCAALQPEKESLITFARWCLPQIFFYGMFVLVGQILNARGTFGPMMWAPITNNIVSIAVIGSYLALYHSQPAAGGYTSSQETLLGLGSTVGIAIQMLVLLPYLRRSGFTIHPRLDFRGTGLGHTMRLGSWTIGFVIVDQIAFWVVTHIATSGTSQSSCTAGGAHPAHAAGFTVYSNAFLITQVPHSIVTVSLATALMPLASRLAAEGRIRELARETAQTLRLVLSVMVPAAIAVLVLGPFLATVLFSWGKGSGQTASLGTTLIAFSPGLLLFSVYYVLLRGFYAMEDTRTPFVVECLIAAVNIVLAVLLTIGVGPDAVAPNLAWAYSASYAAGALALAVLLSRRLGGLAGHETVRFIIRVAVAAFPAAAVAWGVVRGLEAAGLDESSKAASLVMLVAGGAAGLLTFSFLARVLHIREVTKMLSIVVTRLSRV
ncbi:MAG TPA: murein biosynthesis integral membrane protein MurJ [Nocardioidaceae bacterium]|nr:murein biosynthesis integral membrane protein MurJ [Nocardioidaceae bacterium]